MGERALPALQTINWRRFGLAALVAVNAVGLAVTLVAFIEAQIGVDWNLYVTAAHRSSGLYDWTGPLAYRYSPLLVYVFAALAPLGYAGWTALHFAALPLLGRRLALLALVSWPFWSDVYNGNVMVFVFVAAVLALRGHRAAQVVFLSLVLLIPRPLMLPVMAWLLWREPGLRWWFAGLVIVLGLATLATGYGPAWIGSLLTRGADDLGARVDFGPAVLIGPWWTLIGLPLAAWLTWRGRLGLASLAASPYWLPPYLLVALIDSAPYTNRSTMAA